MCTLCCLCPLLGSLLTGMCNRCSCWHAQLFCAVSVQLSMQQLRLSPLRADPCQGCQRESNEFVIKNNVPNASFQCFEQWQDVRYAVPIKWTSASHGWRCLTTWHKLGVLNLLSLAEWLCRKGWHWYCLQEFVVSGWVTLHQLFFCTVFFYCCIKIARDITFRVRPNG